MSDGMKVKVNSLEELHTIIVDMMALATKYNEKYPTYDISIEASHEELIAMFKVEKSDE